jgi:hypothetical protein
MKESGLGPEFLEHSVFDKSKGMVTEGWVTSLWEFLSDSHIQVR